LSIATTTAPSWASLPALESLDGVRLAAALRTGIRRLLQQQEHINKINVFPVPDGDTGTNMALTLHAVFQQIGRVEIPHAGQLLTRVADAALDGARGNSGAILAQFFLGLGDHAAAAPALGANELATAMEGGARYARDAMAEPREGTLLTVLSACALAIREQVQQGTRDVRSILRNALQQSEEATRRTTDQLEHLKRANVVDAGAQGFVELLTGMVGYLDTGIEPDEGLADDTTVVEHDERTTAGETGDLTHRWCTECIVLARDATTPVDRRALREALSTLGSSLVVAGHERKVKVHVHVNEPEAVFRAMEAFGTVQGQKADDMQRQQESAHHARRQQVAIATDSAGDLPESWMERYDIHSVPARVNIGTHSYLDKVTLDLETFLRLLDEPGSPFPKSSQPPPGDFRRLFEFLGSHYQSVVSINVTRANSGTCGAAEVAASRVQSRGGVQVIDSRNASVGQGLLVMAAAEYAATGASREDVVRFVERMRPHSHTYACPTTLEFAVRGGRIPAWAGHVARWLRMTPLICSTAAGPVGIGGVLFGRSGLTQQFARWVGRRLEPGLRYRLLVGHGLVEEQGKQLLAALTAAHPCIVDSHLIEVGTALTVHGGPRLLAVGLQVVPEDLEKAEAIGRSRR
jgi:DegV family protein with EDD domain